MRNGKSVEIDNVEKDQDNGKIFVIKTKYPLQSGSTYILKLGPELESINREAIGIETDASFTTTSKSFDVTNGEFSYNDNELSFSADIKNDNSAPKDVTLAVVIYQNGRVYKTKYLSKTITNTETVKIEYITGETDKTKGKTLVINILDSELVFSFTHENIFAHFTITHSDNCNLYHYLEVSLKVLEKHIELFNNYMKLLQQSL
jgi:hypothetical protein